ncbi:MAG: DUF4260 domain-containing protein [Candidatus Peregrinibacteria bacterium]|nr:DUF4260 domain-containing protein [Candidatus Peregrinibacteria bacterium]
MKSLLRLEELALFLAGIYLFSLLPYPWWIFLVLIVTPDISMIGYLINPKTGAFLYNLFHTRIIGIATLLIAWHLKNDPLFLAGTILFSHSAIDRAMHYGLKYADNFKHTHLGNIK